MTDTKKCTSCGGSLVRESRNRKCKYKKRQSDKVFTIDYEQPGWWCTNCGEGVIKGADHLEHHNNMMELRAAIEGVLSPTKIKEIREKLGLKQREASRIIGGGHNAFQNYESGKNLPSQPTSNLLKLLDKRPEMLAVIKETSKEYNRKYIERPGRQKVEIFPFTMETTKRQEKHV
jgi:HTH-type transcriptional regulator / antitoxin MqsA